MDINKCPICGRPYRSSIRTISNTHYIHGERDICVVNNGPYVAGKKWLFHSKRMKHVSKTKENK